MKEQERVWRQLTLSRAGPPAGKQKQSSLWGRNPLRIYSNKKGAPELSFAAASNDGVGV